MSTMYWLISLQRLNALDVDCILEAPLHFLYDLLHNLWTISPDISLCIGQETFWTIRATGLWYHLLDLSELSLDPRVRALRRLERQCLLPRRTTGTRHLRTDLSCPLSVPSGMFLTKQHCCLSSPRCSWFTGLLRSVETSLWSSINPSLCFLSVDFVVTSSTTSLSTEALERSPARSSQRVDVLDHRIDVLLLAPVLRLKREWSLALTCASACCWLCSFLACSWLCSFFLFSGIIQTVHFTQTVTASLRFRTLFTAPPHALPRAARGLVVSCTTHSPPPRAARVEDVFPELVCSGSSLLSKQLQHCLSPRVFTSTDDRPWQHRQRPATPPSLVKQRARISAPPEPFCGSLQRRTRGLPVWHLRHHYVILRHCVIVGSR